MNILELLKPSDKVALIQGDKIVTYTELLNRGLRFGNRLRHEGIKSGSNVLVFVPLSIELYAAMIGAWSVGASAIFIDYSRGSKFVSDSIERLRPDVIVCDKITGFIRNTYSEMRKIKTLNISKSSQNTKTPIIEKVKPEHPAILTFTSGTTGVPKIAVRTHAFLINQYYVLCEHIDFNENHIDLGTLPVFTLANMAANMTTLLPYKSYKSKIGTKKLAAKADSVGITRAICSPALMENLLKHSELPSLKNAYLGGGPVYPGMLRKIRKDVDLHIVYGSTEAEPISGIRWKDVSETDKQKIASGKGLLVGHIVPQIKCRIGTHNEILVSGDTVLKGYLNGIGDSENKIHDENGVIWHKTGDSGHIDEQGRLWLLGRVSQAIHDEHGTLEPFCAECILDSLFGIRGAVISQNNERIVVIEKSNINPKDVLSALESQQISKVICIKKLPMDKRHGAKVDYDELKRVLLKKLNQPTHGLYS
ncbi:MAG: AMP-binding protein [Oscillospiraceae bacterium]|nr:AMP-binding protein [Oscillospiraceae bacterium]